MTEERRVEIVLPDGQQATVPTTDLDAALAAGARMPSAQEQAAAAREAEVGGVAGQVGTGILGAARVASGGLSDVALAEAANVALGAKARKQVIDAFSLAKTVNPYADMAGEAAGLLGGGGITAAGERAEAAVAARLGEGLVGKVGAMAARGLVEGAAIGAQHQLSEDYLGDHELTGQALFAAAAKDALLGGAAGAGFGAAAHYLSAPQGLLHRSPGPIRDAVLDELAGVRGAGRTVFEDARRTEAMVEAARSAGATTEQAAQMAQEVGTMARARSEAGGLTGLLDDAAGEYAARRAGSNAELREVLATDYAARASKLSRAGEALDEQARAMSTAGTKAMRQLEDTVNEIHFVAKPSQMAKLVDAARVDLQRDAVATMFQETKGTLDFLNSLNTKGGAEGAVKKLTKALADRTALGADASAAEMFIQADKLKRAVGQYAGFGRPTFMRTEAENEFAALYERLRVGLEDESVWGAAGAAQREWNETFSMAKGRRDDFGRRFTVGIDQTAGPLGAGVITPEMDAGKVKGFLGQLGGAEADQAIKTTESFIEGMRARVAAIEKYGDLSVGQRMKLADGREALNAFEQAFRGAQKESEVLARIKAQQADEMGKGVGGILGLVSDAMSKPLTTMQRLAEVRNTVQRIENGVSKGLEKFFGSKGGDVLDRLAPRAKDEAIREMGEIRQVANNPALMESRLSRLVGNLGDVAPKVAAEVRATAQRAVYWLAKEAPPATVRLSLLGIHESAKPRMSDLDVSVWETKRQAALGRIDGKPATEAILADMQRGRLNRDAIQTIEFVSPKLYAHVQELAREELFRMEQRGLLDKMPYQQKAAIAALLKVPADGTWTPAFMAMMQATKMPPPAPEPPQGAAPAPQPQGTKRPMKVNPGLFATDAQTIEQQGSV